MNQPLKSPKTPPSSFEHYFYQIKPILKHRPSTPTPTSQHFFETSSHNDRSFHLITKRPQKTPSKYATYDMGPLKTDSDCDSGKNYNIFKNYKDFPKENQPNQTKIYDSRQNSNKTISPILEIDYNSPVSNIRQAYRLESSDKSPSLVEYETAESIKTDAKNVTGRDLSMVLLEEKSLQDYIGAMETRIKKCEEEEKNIKNKIEITKKFEDKIYEKRKEIECLMIDLNRKKTMNERQKDELRQKNQLEKKLHKENVQKNMNKIYTSKQQKVLQLKENKENLMEKANMKKELEYSEKIVKVNSVLNFEKKLKSKKVLNISQKGAFVKTGLIDQFHNENEKLNELKAKAEALEKQEVISKAKLEDIRQLHMIKYFKLRQLFENQVQTPEKTQEKSIKGYTLASTATFDDRKSATSRKSGSSSGFVHINTSVISLANNNKF